ncbi:CRISPR-associated DxTHG motif protein [Saprospira grandis]|uniref:CRISPR-associated DxTHG motif protein n=1 Tax=Saprospira grandis TaxID=1008 RepID=UPI0022DDDFE2|nr:TM1812 family CRISPR-associated protein [Saprospira grandis]WBM74936.1 hypothetical protein OP864_01600 [Saprospira grandis]
MNQKKKVFISFLGTNGYGEVNYSFTKEEGTTTFFIQEAIFKEEIRKNKDFWNVEKDEIFFFVTALAKKNNYLRRALPFNQKPDKQREANALKLLKEGKAEEAMAALKEDISALPVDAEDGLKYRFEKLQEEGLIGKFQDVAIPDGLSEDEIWEVFARIVEYIGKDTELYFDITNGFRFLPMLTLAIIDYVTSVNNVVLKALYYGNFESGKAEKQKALNDQSLSDKQKKALKKQPVKAPIHRLNSIIELGQWTEAVEMFVRSADAQKLEPLLDQQIGETEQSTLGKELNALAKGIRTSRGKQLTQELKLKEVRQKVIELKQQADNGLKRQLPPLLDRIEGKIHAFNTYTSENGFAAVEWCIEHNMVQQGYTLLQESLITWLIEKTFSDITLSQHEEMRAVAQAALRGNKNDSISNIVSFCFKKKNRAYFNDDKGEMKDVAIKLVNKRKRYNGLKEVFLDITAKESEDETVAEELAGGLRNDINHGGYNNRANSPAFLTQELQNLTNRILQIIQPSYK